MADGNILGLTRPTILIEINMNINYNAPIISALSPGFGGVPRFLERLSVTNRLICPNRNRKYSRISILDKIIRRLVWIFRILSDSEDTAYLMHHNTIPTVVHLLITIRFKSVLYFSIDNSFFCDRSYNFRSGYEPCTLCLGTQFGLPALKNKCQSFPVAKPILSRIIQRYLLRHHVKTGKVYCISNSNKTLLKKHFPNAAVQNVNFSTLEIEQELEIQRRSSPDDSPTLGNPYVVFHGTADPAKGYGYALELARLITDVDFLFPFPKLDHDAPANCHYQSLRWETGLREKVKNANIVLCPSLWSYTPEAAFIKSLIWNDNVFYIENANSFSADTPINVGIRGSGEPQNDAQLLSLAIKRSERGSTVRRNEDSLDFVTKFIEVFNASHFST